MGVELPARQAGEAPFEGFPPGAWATAIPNLFFTTILPRISDPAELAVSVYLFFAHARTKGKVRFLTYDELAADDILASALRNLAEGALRRGLNAAVERGTLLRVGVEHDGRAEELFFLNTAAARRAVAAIKSDRLDVGELLPPAPEPHELKPNVFDLYEQYVGPLTPIIAEYLTDAEKTYPPRWLEEAFRLAAQRNKRRWSYIAGILRRWEAEGPDYEKAGRDSEGDEGRRRSLSGRYRHLVRR
jgi:DNA replication protein